MGVVSNFWQFCGTTLGAPTISTYAGNKGGECYGDCNLTLLHLVVDTQKQKLVVQMVVQLKLIVMVF